jgi:hypothetical protein
MEVFWWNMVDRGISADFGDSEFDASASALRFVCGSGIELTRAHNLLSLRIGQNVNTLWNNPIQVCIAYSNS